MSVRLGGIMESLGFVEQVAGKGDLFLLNPTGFKNLSGLSCNYQKVYLSKGICCSTQIAHETEQNVEWSEGESVLSYLLIYFEHISKANKSPCLEFCNSNV